MTLFLLIKGMLPSVRGQGWQPRVPGCDSAGAAERSYPMHEARGSGWEEQPHVQGAVAALYWSCCEEILHVQGKENPSKMVGVARGHQRADTLKP